MRKLIQRLIKESFLLMLWIGGSVFIFLVLGCSQHVEVPLETKYAGNYQTPSDSSQKPSNHPIGSGETGVTPGSDTEAAIPEKAPNPNELEESSKETSGDQGQKESNDPTIVEVDIKISEGKEGSTEEIKTEEITQKEGQEESQKEMPEQEKSAQKETPVQEEGAEETPAMAAANNLKEKIKDAYARRDIGEFQRLSKLYAVSFPEMDRTFIRELNSKIFYSEKVQIVRYGVDIVEITFPAAQSLEELNVYFSRLHEEGIKAIQINLAQYIGEKVFLFARSNYLTGFYFSTKEAPVVDNLLDSILTLAKGNQLAVFVSFPLRKHPWIMNMDSELMDGVWNPINNQVIPEDKLDLLNPKTRIYLIKLLESLAKYPIDGIIFKKDYTYSPREGFSRSARKRYLETTGRELEPSDLFFPYEEDPKIGFHALPHEEFSDVARWRAEQIHQLLRSISAVIKTKNPFLQLGLELTPSMILNDKISLPWLSVGLEYLTNGIEVDFYILEWKTNNSTEETDYLSYEEAAILLRGNLPDQQQILLKTPLNKETQNIIVLNRMASQVGILGERIHSKRSIVGPINRIENLRIFLNSTTN